VQIAPLLDRCCNNRPHGRCEIFINPSRPARCLGFEIP
jgi:hypothetical protein